MLTALKSPYNSNNLSYTNRNFGDKADIWHSMKAEVAQRLIRRCIETNQTYSMISLNAASDCGQFGSYFVRNVSN